MNLNRRNVLIGIATVAMITGAALGSGAFTSVEADRTMDVSLQGDDTAGTFVELTPNSSLVSTNAGAGTNGQDVLEIDLDALNDDAETTLSPAFDVTNNLGESVGVTVTSTYGGAVSMETLASGQDIESAPSTGDDHAVADGEKVSVVLVINSTQSLSSSTGSITVEANTSLAP